MREVVADIARWRAAGQRVAIARVVGIEGSGPRDPGATMAVNEAGEVAGSVSGGCVEGAVVTEALQALSNGGARRRTYGYSDDEAFAVGLTCGGTVHVLIDPDLPPAFEPLLRALAEDEPVVLATVVARGSGPGRDGGSAPRRSDPAGGGDAADRRDDSRSRLPALGATVLVHRDGRADGSLGSPVLDEVVRRDAAGALAAGLSSTRHYGPAGEARQRAVTVFFEAFAPPPRLLIFGAVDFTAALARVGKLLGYRVTVCDARAVFATPARFPMADEVVVDRPERFLAAAGGDLGPRDAACVLTHDHKFDVPAIVAALGTDVGYLGAMGSRRTHRDRLARLRSAGVDDGALARLMAPIGLDIGARTPEETAVSIVAEIIARRTGKDAPSLRDTSGPIHQPAPAGGSPPGPAPASAAGGSAGSA